MGGPKVSFIQVLQYLISLFLAAFDCILSSLLQGQKQAQDAIAESLKDAPATPAAGGVESRIAHQSLRGSAHTLTKKQEDIRKKLNLNKWKYAELRDTINTSVGK